MGRITVLDQNMVNMIAAGEVIERPASVVKELMENSIDAGATSITVSIEDGGRRLISVADNGCGMDGEDLANAFEPHATSKVSNSSDLHTISTLGFRGEALASITSVSQVRAVSRTKDAAGGNCIEIDCGVKSGVSPCSGGVGTTIQVRDIFYKLPARRKFLRTANTEMSHISEQFTRIALANPEVAMILMHNGRELHRLDAGQPGETQRRRIGQLFSAEICNGLIEFQTNENRLSIRGLLGRPEIARSNNKFQYVFLNGRFIRDKFISHAIREAYRGTVEPDRFGVVFLFIRIPFEDVDVNVHPTKIEVRFYNSNLVHSQILAGLREKLLGTNLETVATIPSAAVRRDMGTARPPDGKIADAMAEFFKKHAPVRTQQRFSYRSAMAAAIPIERTPQLPVNVMQIHDSYIIAQTDDGFVIVDQHALHERILYEELSARVRKSKLESQRLLIPESFELTDAEANAVERHGDLIEKLGVELVPFGPRTMAVQAFPTLLGTAAPADFVRDLLGILTDKELTDDADRLLDAVLNMAACKAAIKAGQKLSLSEMEQLLTDRETTDYANRCPHGRPTIIKFTLGDLEKQFKRT